eukprot:2474506-Lingulodinium_polyedra.AAC.1
MLQSQRVGAVVGDCASYLEECAAQVQARQIDAAAFFKEKPLDEVLAEASEYPGRKTFLGALELIQGRGPRPFGRGVGGRG